MNQTRIDFISSKESFLATIKPIIQMKKGDLIGLDLETTSLDPFSGTIVTIQVGTKDWVNVYDARCLDKTLLEYLLGALENKKVLIFNGKFDLKFLFSKLNILLTNVYDGMLGEALCYAGTGLGGKAGEIKHKSFYSYQDLSLKYAGVTLEKDTQKLFIDTPDIIITPAITEYCANDIIYLFDIYERQREYAIKHKIDHVVDFEMRLLPVTAMMEYQGVNLDVVRWNELTEIAKDYAKKLEIKINDTIYNVADIAIDENEWASAVDMLNYFCIPVKKSKKEIVRLDSANTPEFQKVVFRELFNPSSNKQMITLMHHMGIRCESTSSKILKRDHWDKDFARDLVEFREWTKKVTSFGDNFIDKINSTTGKLHAEFHQGGTGSGRYASFNPNLQNILAKSSYRECFIVPDDTWDMITADYSQIELRILAQFSNDPTMLDAYLTEKDLHSITASNRFKIPIEDLTSEQRKVGKTINFATIYGTSAMGLARNFQIPMKEGQQMLEEYFELYPKVKPFIAGAHAQILKRGYSITPFGRKRFFVMPHRWTERDWPLMYKVCREGFNHIVQGCLPKDSKILTKDGWTPIGEFNGGKVWTGESWAESIKLSMGKSRRVRLYLNDGRTFDCDERHKLLVNDCVWPRWEDVLNIINKPLVRDKEILWGRSLEDVEDWYWIGRMTGDGHFNNYGWGLAFGHTVREIEDSEKFEKWLEKKNFIGKTNSKKGYCTVVDSNNNRQIVGYTKRAKEFWLSLGLTLCIRAKSKRVPDIVYTLDYDRRKAFYQGYFDADGHMGTGTWKFTSSSKQLLEDILKLMQTLNITGRISSPMKNGNGSIWYDLYIHKIEQPLFVEKVDILDEEDMFTLSVFDEKHSYSAEGLISKNCSADMTKHSMLSIFLENPFGEMLKIILTVHDEIVLICKKEITKKAAAFVKAKMIQAGEIWINKIPVEVKVLVGSHWSKD